MTNVDYSLVDWSRAQFALTAIYHWFFVPLTLGLSLLIAIMETIYYRTKNPVWKDITKFWMKLFAINFVIGVATGIILEFEFGTNWANYSWIVGDIFGTPLAIEGIMAFFLEATFVVLMLFGWNKISKGFHLTSTWLVYIGTNLSALWILVANAWMQHPVGMIFNPDTARSEMIDFWAILFSPVAITKFLHTIFSGYVIAALFVTGISSWYLIKGRNKELSLKSLKVSALFGLVTAIILSTSGDESAFRVAQAQPMKLAAMENLYKGQYNAHLAIIGIPNADKVAGDNQPAFHFKLEVPELLSLLAHRMRGKYVLGVEDILNGNYNEGIRSTAEKIEKGKVALQALNDYKVAKTKDDRDAMNQAYYKFQEYYYLIGYGYFNNPLDTVPNVPLIFYSFRLMVYMGTYFILLFLILVIITQRKKFNETFLQNKKWLLWIALWSLPLGYIASELGWIVAEVGRQPWAIQDILPVAKATSHISSAAVQATFIMFALLFTVLLIAEIKIMVTQIKLKKADSLTI